MSFVLFAAGERPCRADLYARRLAATLGAAVVPIAGSAAVADGEAWGSARAGWEALDADARPLIAGTALFAFAPMAAVFAERRAAILIHEPPASAPGCTDADAARAASEKEALASAPLILASSEAAADAIAAGAAVPRERITVVEPPTPELARAGGAGGGETVIFAPDAGVTDHAHAVLFRALAGLFDLEWRVCIAGPTATDPRQAATLAALAARFGLRTRVCCAFHPGDADEEALWLRSDLFATAAVSLGYGMVTAAAMKRGLPVAIAGDAKSVPAIPAAAGAIAPPDDHVQLAKALRRLIFDRDLRASMAEAAWQAGKLLPTEKDVRERLLAALS